MGEELFSTLLQQQQQLNQEQISAASCSPSWINTNLSVNTTQQQQQAVNVLANLIGHIQQQKQNLIEQQQPLYIESQQQQHLNTSSSSSSSISAPTSRLAAIQEEQINLQLQQQSSIVDNIGGDFERNRRPRPKIFQDSRPRPKTKTTPQDPRPRLAPKTQDNF
uniref:Uncharacterized protein n=1 Tax=Meloidogyne incognita TaxID=6306 RepID=A0A914N3Q0_MELIC